jgi:hypothetical protein
MKFVFVAMMLMIAGVAFESEYEQVQDVHMRQSSTTRLMGQGGGSGSITCDTGTINYTSFGAVTSQEITVVTGAPGTYRYTSVVISESTQFGGGSSTGLTVSMGRPGGNDAELTGGVNIPLMISSGSANFQDFVPPPPILTGNYNLVLNFIGDGTHLLNTFTSGAVIWEACHYVGPTH